MTANSFDATLILIVVLLLLGCSEKPTTVVKSYSPDPSVFFTTETWEGSGAASSSFTRLFLHMERNGHSDRELVLDGAYLSSTRIFWHNYTDVTLCVDGRTNTFRNQVTLNLPGDYITIHSHLEESCPK